MHRKTCLRSGMYQWTTSFLAIVNWGQLIFSFSANMSCSTLVFKKLVTLSQILESKYCSNICKNGKVEHWHGNTTYQADRTRHHTSLSTQQYLSKYSNIITKYCAQPCIRSCTTEYQVMIVHEGVGICWNILKAVLQKSIKGGYLFIKRKRTPPPFPNTSFLPKDFLPLHFTTATLVQLFVVCGNSILLLGNNSKVSCQKDLLVIPSSSKVTGTLLQYFALAISLFQGLKVSLPQRL